MKSKQPTRRSWLKGSTAILAGSLSALPARGEADEKASSGGDAFGYCLNTATIRGQKLPLVQKIEIAARAGYTGLEPWISDLEEHVKQGGALKDVGKRLKDNGLTVVSAIDFFEWIVDDDEKRKKALEKARRSMDMLQQVGGLRIAAPPTGAQQQTGLDLGKAAERYRALLELGDQFGVVAEVEVWGFSKTLNRLGDAAFIAIECGHPKACILPDVYHLYKGGSGFEGIRFLQGSAIPVFHFNDYPAKPGRDTINDSYRIFPGDGVAPLKTLLQDLRRIGFKGMLSLELFNKDYWQKDPFLIARLGLEKMQSVVRASV